MKKETPLDLPEVREEIGDLLPISPRPATMPKPSKVRDEMAAEMISVIAGGLISVSMVSNKQALMLSQILAQVLHLREGILRNKWPGAY